MNYGKEQRAVNRIGMYGDAAVYWALVVPGGICLCRVVVMRVFAPFNTH